MDPKERLFTAWFFLAAAERTPDIVSSSLPWGEPALLSQGHGAAVPAPGDRGGLMQSLQREVAGPALGGH